MQSVLFLVALLGAALAQYDVTQYYNDPACSANYISISASTPTSAGCTTVTCTQVSGNTYYTISCNIALPAFPSNPIAAYSYSSTDCSGTASSLGATSSGACINNVGGTSAAGSCSSQTEYTSPNCQGNATTGSAQGAVSGCLTINQGGVGSIYVSCPKCFHADTKIAYEGQTLALAELKKGHPSCAVPHEYKADGLKITTTCEGSLRVTDEHLVYTQKGLVMASTVKVGDFLYQDKAQKKTCEIVAVEKEQDQSYFALNCEESVVLADGYKTSTFGLTHDLPAIWMKYAAKVIGIERASGWGDVLGAIFSGLF